MLPVSRLFLSFIYLFSLFVYSYNIGSTVLPKAKSQMS